ncbi:multiubiquitin domain-containing protein [Ferruginibacter sp.]
MLVENSYKFILDGRTIEWNKFITGAEIRKAASINEDFLIFLKVEGLDEEIKNDDKIDLARFGIEHFYTVSRHPTFKLTIDGKDYKWTKFITGKELRKLGDIPPDSLVFLKVQGKDEEIADNEKVDLARIGIEHFYSKHKQPKLVEIKINNKGYEVKPGIYTVAELKKQGNIPATHELEQLVDGKLVPLADDAKVEIKGCEQFFSHVRDGASS